MRLDHVRAPRALHGIAAPRFAVLVRWKSGGVDLEQTADETLAQSLFWRLRTSRAVRRVRLYDEARAIQVAKGVSA